MTKKCFKCKQTKSLDLFYKHPQMQDGHLNKCKACTKKDVADRYRNPDFREKIIAYEKARYATPERKAKTLEYQRKRRKLKPGKNRARAKAGKLPKQSCEVCGNDRAEAHHTDYRKALDVKWLCFRHHREEHGQKPN